MSGILPSSSSSSDSASAKPTSVEHTHSNDLGHKKGHGELFSGMKEYKRDPENAAGQARRESIKDMSAKPQGILSSVWNSTFKSAESK